MFGCPASLRSSLPLFHFLSSPLHFSSSSSGRGIDNSSRVTLQYDQNGVCEKRLWSGTLSDKEKSEWLSQLPPNLVQPQLFHPASPRYSLRVSDGSPLFSLACAVRPLYRVVFCLGSLSVPKISVSSWKTVLPSFDHRHHCVLRCESSGQPSG